MIFFCPHRLIRLLRKNKQKQTIKQTEKRHRDVFLFGFVTDKYNCFLYTLILNNTVQHHTYRLLLESDSLLALVLLSYLVFQHHNSGVYISVLFVTCTHKNHHNFWLRFDCAIYSICFASWNTPFLLRLRQTLLDELLAAIRGHESHSDKEGHIRLTSCLPPILRIGTRPWEAFGHRWAWRLARSCIRRFVNDLHH